MVTKKGSISSDPSRLLPAAVTAPQVVTHHPVINCAHAVQVRPPPLPPLLYFAWQAKEHGESLPVTSGAGPACGYTQCHSRRVTSTASIWLDNKCLCTCYRMLLSSKSLLPEGKFGPM